MSVDEHELEHEWTIFYDRAVYNKERSSNKVSVEESAWVSQHNKVGSFGTISGFWSFWNNLVPPSRLPLEGTYSCFLSHISPAWEDVHNEQGGEVRVFFNKAPWHSIDAAWSNLLLCAVGETFLQSDDETLGICGLTVSRKKHKSKISVWINKCDAESRAALEKSMSLCLGLEMIGKYNLQLEWTSHQQLLDKEKRKDTSSSGTIPSIGGNNNNNNNNNNNGQSWQRSNSGYSKRNARAARPPSIGDGVPSH